MFSGSEPEFQGEDLKLYTGSCHCGLIRIALKSKPLPEVELKEDNCSICVRVSPPLPASKVLLLTSVGQNAWIGTYPRKAQVSIVGKESETDYLLFGRGFSGSPFCKLCGVHVYTNLYGPPRHLVESWPEARQAIVREKLDIRPLNLRALDGVEWDRLTVNRTDEGTEGYILEED